MSFLCKIDYEGTFEWGLHSTFSRAGTSESGLPNNFSLKGRREAIFVTKIDCEDTSGGRSQSNFI